MPPPRRRSAATGALFALLGGFAPGAHAADTATNETVVLLGHAEKPAAGLGQLDCQGLKSWAGNAVKFCHLGRRPATGPEAKPAAYVIWR